MSSEMEQILPLTWLNIKRLLKQPLYFSTLLIIAVIMGIMCRLNQTELSASMVIICLAVGLVELRRIWTDKASGYRMSLLASGASSGSLAVADLMSWLISSAFFSILIDAAAHL